MQSRLAARIMLIAAGSFVAGRIGLLIPYFNSSISLFWMPTGIGVAALVLYGPRMFLAVFVGSFLINVTTGSSIPVSAGIALGSASAIFLTHWILIRTAFRHQFTSARDVALLILAAMVGMQVSAIVGVASLYAGGILPAAALVGAWQAWWCGDFVGVLVAAPFLMSVSKKNLKSIQSRWAEFLVLVLFSLAISSRTLLFSSETLFVALSFMGIMWAAFRFAQVGSFAIVLLISGATAFMASTPQSNFHGTENGRFIIWSYMCAMSLCSLLIASLKTSMEDAIGNDKIRLRTILDTVSSPIFVKNNDHQIILANTSFCDFFALDIKDVLGKTLAETVPEDEKVHFLAIDRMVLDTGNPSTIEETITFAGKPTRKIVTNKTRFTEISGTHFLVGSIHDVTALRESERSLAQASKLASLGELAAGIAHEINNPLAIILGSVSLLAKYRDNPEKSASKIEAVQKSCDRIARIVSGLKKFSRSGEAASFRTHSLSDIAKEVLVLTESKSKRHLTPVMLECLTQAQILCDEVEIEQVLVNLINNGIDAVKSRAEKWVKISIVEDGPAVVLRVMDSGPGIPESVCAKLYDPFFTTKKVGEGTGLGLSITKGILTAHGATITVVAECPNTCFEIRFSKAEALKFAA